jgi:ribosomal-protein-serine acetyltransferase
MRSLEPIRVDAEITLVPRHPDDAREMHALMDRHRDSLREWLTWIDATKTLAEVRRYAQFAQAQYETHAAFDYAIRSNGELVGSMGLHGLDWASRSAEIGYWLSPDSRGTGIVTRSARGLITYAFTRLDLHRVEIRCVIENERSRAVPVRLGLELEGISRRPICSTAASATSRCTRRRRPAGSVSARELRGLRVARLNVGTVDVGALALALDDGFEHRLGRVRGGGSRGERFAGDATRTADRFARFVAMQGGGVTAPIAR